MRINNHEINTGDTPEMIQICLNCGLPKCVEPCPKMRKAKERHAAGKPGVTYPYKGEYMCLAEAGRQSGIDSRTLKYRIQKYGMTLEQAIQKGPPIPRRRKEKK